MLKNALLTTIKSLPKRINKDKKILVIVIFISFFLSILFGSWSYFIHEENAITRSTFYLLLTLIFFPISIGVFSSFSIIYFTYDYESNLTIENFNKILKNFNEKDSPSKKNMIDNFYEIGLEYVLLGLKSEDFENISMNSNTKFDSYIKEIIYSKKVVIYNPLNTKVIQTIVKTRNERKSNVTKLVFSKNWQQKRGVTSSIRFLFGYNPNDFFSDQAKGKKIHYKDDYSFYTHNFYIVTDGFLITSFYPSLPVEEDYKNPMFVFKLKKELVTSYNE